MPIEEDGAIIRRLDEAFNKRTLSLFDELILLDFNAYIFHRRALDTLVQITVM